jgi:hypothetical protein
VTTRSLLRFMRWVLEPDREPDAEPVAFLMQCAVCQLKSPSSVEFDTISQWTFQHAARHPSHHTYREIITRPWRAWMKGSVR